MIMTLSIVMVVSSLLLIVLVLLHRGKGGGLSSMLGGSFYSSLSGSSVCANGHETRPAFALDAVLPDTWDCPRCGFPAGQQSEAPPNAPRNEPYKTHLAYVKERRSDEDGAAILEEALARLRARRGE